MNKYEEALDWLTLRCMELGRKYTLEELGL